MDLPYSAEEIISEDGTVTLSNILTFEEMRERWPGVSDVALAEMLQRKRIFAYFLVGKFMEKTTGAVFFKCKPRWRPYEHQDGETIRYDWENIVFKLEDVVVMESNNPGFKLIPVVVPPVVPPSNASIPAASPDSWVFCDTLADRWGWSPFDVIGLLEKQGLPFRRSFGAGVPDIHHLQEAQVHVVDLARWEHENAEKINRGSSPTGEGEGLRTENVKLAAQVAELQTQLTALRDQREREAGPLCGLAVDILEGDLVTGKQAQALHEKVRQLAAENVELRAENEKLRAQEEVPPAPEEPAPAPKRTASASKTVEANRLKAWKEDVFPALILVALECAEKGVARRKRSELRNIAKQVLGEGKALSLFGQNCHGKKRSVNPEPLEMFWKALPERYKDTTPGAPKQE